MSSVSAKRKWSNVAYRGSKIARMSRVFYPQRAERRSIGPVGRYIHLGSLSGSDTLRRSTKNGSPCIKTRIRTIFPRYIANIAIHTPVTWRAHRRFAIRLPRDIEYCARGRARERIVPESRIQYTDVCSPPSKSSRPRRRKISGVRRRVSFESTACERSETSFSAVS